MATVTLTGGSDTVYSIGGGAGENVTGSNDGDSIYLNASGADFVYGRGGNDTIYTANGSDTVIGGTGADFIDAGNSSDVVITGDTMTVAAGLGDTLLMSKLGTTVDMIAIDDNQSDTINGGDNSGDIAWAGQGDFADGGGPPNIQNGDTLIIPAGYSSVPGATFLDTRSGITYDQIFADSAGHTIYATHWETIITDPSYPCFATGTRIATARGEVAVEDLRVGDLVVTAGGRGALQPVIWIGHSDVNVARHAQRGRIAPVLIKAGALAANVPFRDLRVSPDHAMLIDGNLIPAGMLVNGTTIIQEMWCPQVTYWHVELPTHSVLIAEGAAAESYLDDGNRKHFDNGAIATLFKDFASERTNGVYEREACYPVLRGGEKLEAVRAKLATLAEGLTKTATQVAAKPARRA